MHSAFCKRVEQIGRGAIRYVGVNVSQSDDGREVRKLEQLTLVLQSNQRVSPHMPSSQVTKMNEQNAAAHIDMLTDHAVVVSFLGPNGLAARHCVPERSTLRATNVQLQSKIYGDAGDLENLATRRSRNQKGGVSQAKKNCYK